VAERKANDHREDQAKIKAKIRTRIMTLLQPQRKMILNLGLQSLKILEILTSMMKYPYLILMKMMYSILDV
jgi:ABC-type branched-subunit amino acid transport system ATPase component